MAAHMKRKPLLTLCLALSLSLLSACGFHLRGDYAVDPAKQQLHLTNAGQDVRLEQALGQVLRDSGIVASTDAPYTLEVNRVRFQRKSISLDSSARVDEYELNLRVEYSLRQQGSDQVRRLSAETERTYTYNADRATAADELFSLHRDEMYRVVADRILRSYLSYQPAQ